MKKCDRCGVESRGCEIGFNFTELELIGEHVDLCEQCGERYWKEMADHDISFKQRWLKEMEMEKHVN